VTGEGDAVTATLPDWGFVMVDHDGHAWRLMHQNGAVLQRTDQIPADDRAGARAWMRQIVVAEADQIPAGMGHDSEIYLLDRDQSGALVASPTGGFFHDGTGWVYLDSLGHVTDRADRIGLDEYGKALDWVDGVIRSKPGYRRQRVRRLNVGVFPDGSYAAWGRPLGPQRMRRAWNWMLDKLRL
jgi:hypothetical protein